MSVYFLRPIGGAQPLHGPFVATAHRAVPQTLALATAAVNALLAGPTARERGIAMTSDIPAGTTLRGVKIAAGVATVDLSNAFAATATKAAMTARLAQVVYTLTQFPSVEGVLFKVDGAALTSFGATGISFSHPQRRADYEAVTPPIFVESPAPFDTVTGTLHAAGTADVFEATFRARLVVGSVARTITVTASSGSGTRGVFSLRAAAAGNRRHEARRLGRLGRERRRAAHGDDPPRGQISRAHGHGEPRLGRRAAHRPREPRGLSLEKTL